MITFQESILLIEVFGGIISTATQFQLASKFPQRLWISYFVIIRSSWALANLRHKREIKVREPNDDLRHFLSSEERSRQEAFSEVVTLPTLVGYSISTFLATLDFCARTSKTLEAIKINIESAKHVQRSSKTCSRIFQKM